MIQPFHILVVEDNVDDEFMIRRSFQRAHIINEIVCLRDGEEALDYLLKRGVYADATHEMPGLVMLDLNLPRLTGQETLQQLEQHSVLAELPVVVLTVSDSTEDILDCYDSGAYAYLKKPLTTENIMDFIVSEKFFDICLVPSQTHTKPR
jgi:CheY-like chemotaxis protein